MYNHFFLEDSVSQLIDENFVVDNKLNDAIGFCYTIVEDVRGKEVLLPGPFNAITSDTTIPTFTQTAVHLDNNVDVQIQAIFHTTPLPEGFEGIIKMLDQASKEGRDFSGLEELTMEEFSQLFQRELTPVECAVLVSIVVAQAASVDFIHAGKTNIWGTEIYYTLLCYDQVLTNSAAYCVLNDTQPQLLH